MPKNCIGKPEAAGNRSQYIYLFIYFYSALPTITESELKVLYTNMHRAA